MKTLYCAKILTLASPLYAEAMLVEDGRILAVGRRSEICGTHTDINEAIETNGVIMPSFIDCHGHFNSMAARRMQCSVRGADSVEQIAAGVAAFIEKMQISEGEWVTVSDYDENLLPERKHPTLSMLDSICPRNPLRIMHASGHAGLANSLALKLCGITADTPDPSGGEIGRTNGVPNGYLSESAMGICNKHVPNISIEDMRRGCIEAQKQYAAYGITTVQDGYLSSRMLDLYLDLAATGELKLDVVGYVPVSSYEKLCEAYEGRCSCPRVRIGGIKTFADGSPQLKTAWVREPYLDGSYGIPNRSDEAMLEGVRLAAKHNAQMLCHANGDAAVEQFLRAVEKVEELSPRLRSTRPVVIHGQLTGLDQLPLAKKTGAMISFFVAHTYHWGDVHTLNLGQDRAQRISPVRSALEAGVRVTFHQDPPVILPDMLETVWCAVCRETRSGKTLAGEQISVLEAIRAVTVDAAYQYHEEDIKGTLEAGKKADFIILDRDLLEIPKQDIRNARILATYKEGECIYKADE